MEIPVNYFLAIEMVEPALQFKLLLIDPDKVLDPMKYTKQDAL